MAIAKDETQTRTRAIAKASANDNFAEETVGLYLVCKSSEQAIKRHHDVLLKCGTLL
jgi:hypothetical protein